MENELWRGVFRCEAFILGNENQGQLQGKRQSPLPAAAATALIDRAIASRKREVMF